MIASRSNSLFATLSLEDLEALHQAGEAKTYKDGHFVFRQGDAGNGMYLVMAGKVRIAAEMGDFVEKTLAFVHPGDFFGEMAVLDSEPRSANAVAEGDTLVLFLPREEVLTFLEHSPKAAVNLVREFSRRMREFNKRFVQEMMQADRMCLVGKFAGSIVHDFKNPLSIIGMSAELGTMKESTPEMREQSRVRILKQVNRMNNMIRELLEFAKGSQVIELTGVNYAEFLQPLLEDLRAESAAQKVEIVLENQPPEIDVGVDANRLPNLFYNLVHNAVEAMKPKGGRVIFRFQTTKDLVVTEVQDTGKGIPPQIMDKLFEPFATYGKSGGTGLGLSICERIVKDHGGVIVAHNAPEGGAVFTITLPVYRGKQKAAAKPEADTAPVPV